METKQEHYDSMMQAITRYDASVTFTKVMTQEDREASCRRTGGAASTMTILNACCGRTRRLSYAQQAQT